MRLTDEVVYLGWSFVNEPTARHAFTIAYRDWQTYRSNNPYSADCALLRAFAGQRPVVIFWGKLIPGSLMASVTSAMSQGQDWYVPESYRRQLYDRHMLIKVLAPDTVHHVDILSPETVDDLG